MKCRSTLHILFLRLSLLGLVGSAFSGCALKTTLNQADAYRSSQASQNRDELDSCRTHVAEPSAWDQRPTEASGRDCYLAGMVGSFRPLFSSKKADKNGLRSKPSLTGNALTASALSSFHSEEAKKGVHATLNFPQLQSANEAVRQVAWMALLSKMVYRKFVHTEMRSDQATSCTYAPELHPLPRLYASVLHRPDTEDAFEELRARRIAHWELWKPEAEGCMAQQGLFYETYVFLEYEPGSSSAGRISQAVLVFRGTENDAAQWRPDWGANFATVFDRFSPQHALVQRSLAHLVGKLVKESQGEIPIYATGHSLGGGLAQMAAYLQEKIVAAYVFNPSPATAWTKLQEQLKNAPHDPDQLQVQDPIIIRVMQDDEALGIVREISNAANTLIRRTGRSDLVLDFPATREVLAKIGPLTRVKNAIELHDMGLLACNLAARVAQSAEPAAFAFTPAMASAALADRQGAHQEPGRAQTGLCQVVKRGAEEWADRNCKVDWIAATVDCSTRAHVTARK